MTDEKAQVPPAPLGRVGRGGRPLAHKLASQLQNAAYNHGYEDAHPANATTRQDKAAAKTREVLAALYEEIDRLEAKNAALAREAHEWWTAARDATVAERKRCALRVALHSQYPIETDYDRGYDKARKDAAETLRNTSVYELNQVAATPEQRALTGDVFDALDLRPEQFLTEGGLVNRGKLRAALWYPHDYLPEGHWMRAADEGRLRAENSRLAREARTWWDASQTYAAELERHKPLMQVVAWILEDGHMNQEHLARMRAAWEAC